MTALREVPRLDQEASRSALMDERRERFAAIEAMPEAEGKTIPVKFALAFLRFDLSLAQLRSLLSEAPTTDNTDDILEWIDIVQAKPNLRLVR